MSVKTILTGQSGGSSVELSMIEITTPPSKTRYISGERFDNSGMVIMAHYAIDGIELQTAEVSGYSASPDPVVDGYNEITISYSETGIIKQTTYPITVIHALTSLTIENLPNKTTYEYGDTLNTSGLAVRAHYSDGASALITGWTCTPTTLSIVTNSQTITVSYTENGITKTATFTVVVNKKSISTIPSQSNSLTYNGSSQTPTWNNYNSVELTLTGTLNETTAGNYTATFTPTANYRWSDGSSSKNVTWTIAKAPGSASLSAATATLTGSNYSIGVAVTVTRSGTGAISATSSSSAIASTTVSGTTITIKGDGKTGGNATITVNIAEDINYTAVNGLTIEITASYWSGFAKETWANIQTCCRNNAANLGDYIKVGDQKDVTLSSAVQGTTSHKVVVIGVNQDGTGTIACQTLNCLANATTFGSNAAWIGSSARSICQSYYNAFPEKSAIKTVKKGTCPSTNDSRNGTPTYNDETVFLLSEREFGLNSYSPLSTENSNTNKAECTQGYNAAYSYFTSNTQRIKKNGDGGSAQYHWERSRLYDSGGSNRVCGVYAGGTAGLSDYYGSYRVAPAFVIG